MKQVYQFTEIVAAQAGAAIAERTIAYKYTFKIRKTRKRTNIRKRILERVMREILYVNERRQRMVGRRYGLVI